MTVKGDSRETHVRLASISQKIIDVASSNGTVKFTALWLPASSSELCSLPVSIAVGAFAGRCLGLDQPKKKPWAWDPGLACDLRP